MTARAVFGLPGLLCLLSLLPAFPAAAQEGTPFPTDTLLSAPDTSRHSPRGALRRAAVLPGWGQVYNRQYLKLPFVYLGLAGFTAGALLVNNDYLLYRRAYHYAHPAHYPPGGTPKHPEYKDEYDRVLAANGQMSDEAYSEAYSPEEAAARRNRLDDVFKAQRDNLRRNRDLLYFGVGLWYGLTVLDAYVNAHLLDFDIDEDLSLDVYPHARGLTARARLSF